MIKQTSLQLLKSGNQIEYRRLYDAHRAAFVAFAHTYKISEEIGIEIYQDAFIVLYENVASGKLTSLSSSIKTYLFSIGKYKILEHHRARKKLVRVTEDEFDVVTHEIVMEEEIENTQQQQLQEILPKLGKRCRNILELFYLQGLKIDEIKQAEGYENANTVKAQKSRCLKQLKSLLKTSQP